MERNPMIPSRSTSPPHDALSINQNAQNGSSLFTTRGEPAGNNGTTYGAVQQQGQSLNSRRSLDDASGDGRLDDGELFNASTGSRNGLPTRRNTSRSNSNGENALEIEPAVTDETDAEFYARYLSENQLARYGQQGRSGLADLCRDTATCWQVCGFVLLTMLAPLVVIGVELDFSNVNEISRCIVDAVLFAGTFTTAVIFLWDFRKPAALSGIANFETPEESTTPICATPLCIFAKLTLVLLTAVAVTVVPSLDYDEILDHSEFHLSWHYLMAYPIFVLLCLLIVLVNYGNKCSLIVKAANDELRLLRNQMVQVPTAAPAQPVTLDTTKIRKQYLNSSYLVQKFNESFSFALSLGLSILAIHATDLVRMFIFACYEESWIYIGVTFSVGVGLLFLINFFLFYAAKVSNESIKMRDLIADLSRLASDKNCRMDDILNAFLKEDFAPIAVEFFNAIPITSSFIVVFNACVIAYAKLVQPTILLQKIELLSTLEIISATNITRE